MKVFEFPLMERVKMISGETPHQFRWGSHSDAMRLLLQLRGSKQLGSPSNSCEGLVRIAHAIVVSRCDILKRLLRSG